MKDRKKVERKLMMVMIVPLVFIVLLSIAWVMISPGMSIPFE